MSFGRLQRRPVAPPMGEINMTPLIDVMLVLLVIFIVAAPLMASRLRLDLPRTEGAQAADAAATLMVAIDAEGRVFLGAGAETPAPSERWQEELANLARAAAQRNPATEVHLRADTRVPYGRVAEAIGLVQRAGLTRVGFVTESPSAR